MITQNDFKNSMTVLNAAAVASKTATFNGGGVDLINYDGRFAAFVKIGAVTGTTPTLDVKVQESADNSTWSDISGATFAQLTATGTDGVMLDCQRQLRYARLVFTIAGTTPVFLLSADFLAVKKII